MDQRVVCSLIASIIFLVMASAPVFSIVRDMGVKDKDMSLVVRSVLAGLLTYVSMISLM
jgi:hypothetical protein